MSHDNHAHQLGRHLEIADHLADIVTVYGLRAMIGLHYRASDGWSLLFTTPHDTPDAVGLRLDALADEFEFVFTPMLDAGDRVTFRIEPLPDLTALGSPVTVPITNPTA